MKTIRFIALALAAVVGFCACDNGNPGVSDITLNKTTLVLMIGETQTLIAEITPHNAENNNLTWYSDNQNAVFVDANGKIMALGSGRANIIVTAVGVKAAVCMVTVLGLDDEIPIPDALFKLYLRLASIDGDETSPKIDANGDGIISLREAQNVTHLYVEDKGIETLEGLEYFSNLKRLSCYDNRLTALDVSKNRALTNLYCGYNQLSVLNTTNNRAMSVLYCNNNFLTELNITNNTALTNLKCSENTIVTLNVENNRALTNLVCHSNQIAALNLSEHTELLDLVCSDNQLTELNLSGNRSLSYLGCTNNLLRALDLSNNTALDELYCGNQQTTLQLTLPASLESKWLQDWQNGYGNENIEVNFR